MCDVLLEEVYGRPRTTVLSCPRKNQLQSWIVSARRKHLRGLGLKVSSVAHEYPRYSERNDPSIGLDPTDNRSPWYERPER